MPPVEIETQARLSKGRAVRVVLPAKVAFNLDEFQRVTRELAERLGCLPCISGAACWFQLENDFVVDPQGKLQGSHGGGF